MYKSDAPISMWSWFLLTSMLLLSSWTVVMGAKEDVNYCSQFGTDHTMCLHEGKSTTCDFVDGAPTMNDATIDDIVDEHNRLREEVATGNQEGQPPASNMRELVWSAELAVVAQRWTDQCRFAHDGNRVTPAFPKYVGQNAAFRSSYPEAPPLNFTGPINWWYNEVNDYTPTSADNVLQFSHKTGHYTQLVWANTYAVGCGFAQYREDIDDNKFITNLYVCNYGPGGNIDGQPLYQVGPACSACDAGVQCSSHFPGLCATPPSP